MSREKFLYFFTQNTFIFKLIVPPTMIISVYFSKSAFTKDTGTTEQTLSSEKTDKHICWIAEFLNHNVRRCALTSLSLCRLHILNFMNAAISVFLTEKVTIVFTMLFQTGDAK